MPASVYKFVQPASYNFEFAEVDTNKKIGELRLKPSSILWKPKGAREYHAASLDDFITWMKTKGTVSK